MDKTLNISSTFAIIINPKANINYFINYIYVQTVERFALFLLQTMRDRAGVSGL
jgi:hypothetical protein